MHVALRTKPLVTESLLLVGAAGSLGSRRRRTLEQVSGLPLLLMSRPNGIREELERIWAEKGITPNVVANLNAPRLLLDAVQSGLGYGILPSCVFDRTQPTWKVDAVELRSGAPLRTVCIATSMLFPISLAAQRVHDIVEMLVYRAVKDGRWDARTVDGNG
jgi:DNA-binding transcriptional LysR family regulator